MPSLRSMASSSSYLSSTVRLRWISILFLATTNYPERLDRRFIERPSRFDTIKHIEQPSPSSRREFLKAKEPSLSPTELDEWVELSAGFSIAHLKELVIAVKCLDQTPLMVRERFDKMI